MAHRFWSSIAYGCAATFLVSPAQVRGDDSADVQTELRRLQQQNESLQDQLRKQQQLIDSLLKTVKDIQAAENSRTRELDDLKTDLKESAKPSSTLSFGKVNISGEGGVGFFNSGHEGIFPHSEFRVDEARLFVEAAVWNDVYFFGELNLLTREAYDLSLQLGELYLDFEDISRLWNRDHMLNLRAGRMYIPFGEEYLARFAIDNPLISHSLSDLWGTDQGVELYGKIQKLSYAVAVQSGGPSGVRDFGNDKSVAGRISYDPARWLHLSVSGLRTGDLASPNDYWSALWFGNGWFLPFSGNTVTKYHANLVEGDLEVRLPRGHIKAFGGYARYNDNDPLADNSRDIFYYSVEGVYGLMGKLYAAARFSEILADKGFPIAGNGDHKEYLFSSNFTDQLWRLSLGLGYRFSPNLIVKGEYSFERGHTVLGDHRDHEDLFALQAAFKF